MAKKIVRSSTMKQTVKEGKTFTGRRLGKRIRKPANNTMITFPPVKRAKKAKRQNVTRPSRPAKPKPRRVPTGPKARVPVATAPRRASSKSSMGAGNLLEHELVQRLDTNRATYGKLNFSLRWYDPNDLDLHVICPCGTEIYFGHKKCDKCGGELDIDMNVGCNMSLQPVEHVYFNNAKSGNYKFWGRYFSRKEYSGVKGKASSKYIMTIHTQDIQLQRFEQKVTQTQREIHHEFNI